MAEEDERIIRELYVEEIARPQASHPDEAAWELLALGQLAGAERQGVFDHATRCAECLRVYRGVKLIQAEAGAFDAAAPRRPARLALVGQRAWLFAGAAAAAALLMALVLPLSLHVPQPAPADGLRSDALQSPEPLEPLGHVASRPAAFRWQAVPGAGSYRLELTRPDGERLWQSPPVEKTTVAWPSSVPAAPGEYYWRVTALPGPDRLLGAPRPSTLAFFEIAGSSDLTP